jgi:hypothetical protein
VCFSCWGLLGFCVERSMRILTILHYLVFGRRCWGHAKRAVVTRGRGSGPILRHWVFVSSKLTLGQLSSDRSFAGLGRTGASLLAWWS